VLVCVATGVGRIPLGADAEIDSLAGDWRPTLRPELESMLIPLLSTKWRWKQDNYQ